VNSEAGPRLGYRPELDGVRAVGILLVVAFHAYARPESGFLGVDIFFVLSGFLITALLVQEQNLTGAISLPHFYLRRALRLLPALVVAVLGYLLITTADFAVGDTKWPQLADALEGSGYGLAYVSNVVQAAGVEVPGAIGHLWSLATEEQFYLIWPFALVLLFRSGLSRRTVSIVLGAAIAALFGHRLQLTLSDTSVRRMYFGPDGHFDVILVGCLAGLWFASGRVPALIRLPRYRRFVGPAALAVAVTMLVLIEFRSRALYLGLYTLFAAAVAVLLLTMVVSENSRLARLLALRPMVFIGKISYAFYLWHAIFIGGVLSLPDTVAAAIAFGAATLSYYIVERPFLRLKWRDRAKVESRRSRAATTLVLPEPAEPARP
jgi:peptidoglycan/LPS O-acetylase OafA/YrhL